MQQQLGNLQSCDELRLHLVRGSDVTIFASFKGLLSWERCRVLAKRTQIIDKYLCSNIELQRSIESDFSKKSQAITNF